MPLSQCLGSAGSRHTHTLKPKDRPTHHFAPEPQNQLHTPIVGSSTSKLSNVCRTCKKALADAPGAQVLGSSVGPWGAQKLRSASTSLHKCVCAGRTLHEKQSEQSGPCGAETETSVGFAAPAHTAGSCVEMKLSHLGLKNCEPSPAMASHHRQPGLRG